MMRNEGIIALTKLLVVGLLFSGSILIVRKIAAEKRRTAAHQGRAHKILEKGKTYFIGSSRTRCSIDDSLLNSRFSGAGFVNIGIDNGTFIFNKIVADKIMQNGQPEVLFIELSVINARLPSAYRLLTNGNDIIKALTPLMKGATIDDTRKIFWPMVERAFLSQTRLGPEIKSIFGGSAINGRLGFSHSAIITAKSPSVIPAKLLADKQDAPAVHPLYGQIINELTLKAQQTGTRLVFFIPPAMKTTEEKEVLTAVFNSIPRENKVLYDQEFLAGLNDKALFKDEIHLNTTGSQVYTNYLADQAVQNNWIKNARE
jgi:hypothetical protein